MAHQRLSQYSLVSAQSEDFERNYLPYGYELHDIPQQHAAKSNSKKGVVVTEERLLLNENDGEAKQDYSNTLNSKTLSRPFQAKLNQAKGFLSSHNPITTAGREELMREITRSGHMERIETDSQSVMGSKTTGSHFFKGWRMGVFFSLIAVTICLIVELFMLALAMMLNKEGGDKDGIGVLYVGDCAQVERITTILGIPLNIIATVLVATSNYVMQCLSAPSRREVNKAHASGSYLNIGISSVHNLVHNLSMKSVLWVVLLVSTIPIHLFLNSAFFGSLQANNYGVMIAYEGWDNYHDFDAAYNYDIGWNGTNSTLTLDGLFVSHMTLQSKSATSPLQRLTPDECFARYSKQLQSTASNVVLVIGNQSSNYSDPYYLHNETHGSYFEWDIYWYNYTLAPPFRNTIDFDSLLHDFPLYVDPMKTFDMQRGIGLSFNPSSGNAVPLFDETYHWTSAIRPANVSGGLFYILNEWDDYDFQPFIPSVFSSFDYNYWTIIKEYEYNFNDARILMAGQWNPNSWMCPIKDMLAGEVCTGGSKSVPKPWLVTPNKFEVDYCLSENTEEKCSLQYSFHILLIVIGCDVAKMIAMAAALWLVSDHPLTTIGDAVASFLESPDSYTRGCCLMQQSHARKACSSNLWRRVSGVVRGRHVYDRANRSLSERLGQNAFVWKTRISHWYSAPSKSRWIAFGFLYAALFSSSLAVLGLGIRDLRQMGITAPFSTGFGSINPNAIFEYPASFDLSGSNGTYNVVQTNKPANLLADVVTVNTPQLLFSSLYFMYNGMFTCMLTAAEWSQLARVRKALRVSEPKAGQRSTYWLQLPWKYSLPLLCISSLLHWLVSRSLFIVRIAVFGYDGKAQSDRDISACGYSPLAILITIIVVFLSLVVMVWVSFRKLPPGIPLCGSNSLAIAAACHSSPEDEDPIDPKAACRPLHWGVTMTAKKGSPGHCCITSDPNVGWPKEGMEYR